MVHLVATAACARIDMHGLSGKPYLDMKGHLQPADERADNQRGSCLPVGMMSTAACTLRCI